MAKKKAGAQLQPTPRPEPPTDDGDVELTPTAPKADTRVSDTVIESEPEVVDLAKIEVVSLLADAFAQLKSSLGSTSQKYHLVVVPTDENARMQTFTDRASLVATLRSLYGTDVQVFVFHGDLPDRRFAVDSALHERRRRRLHRVRRRLSRTAAGP